MLINCDIGERGVSHPVDRELMNYIHIANIACGGHEGDGESIAYYSGLARQKGVKVTAHLSYPDRSRFGRVPMDIPWESLRDSLEEQYGRIGSCGAVKLHGALYNRCVTDGDLAHKMADWFLESDIAEVLCPDRSAMALSCRERNISVLPEAFAERTYMWDSEESLLILTPRNLPDAHIVNADDAFSQYKQLLQSGTVSAFTIQRDGRRERSAFPLKAGTVCIHSDSPIALELAERMSRYGQTLQA